MRMTWAVLVLIVAIAGPAAADEPSVNRLRLRGSATVYGDAALLGDVLSFAKAAPELAEHLAEQPVRPAGEASPCMVVTHDQIVQRLDELGVNLSRVLVCGALRCEIELKPRTGEAAPAAARAETGGASGPLLRRVDADTGSGGRTLAALLREHISRELSEFGGTADVTFERAGEGVLELTAPPWEFGISGNGRGSKLGLREFRVVIRRDGRVQRTVHIYADVRLSREVVVARQPLSIGNFIRRDAVSLETRLFSAGGDIGLGSLNEVVGQQVKSFVPTGEMIPSSGIKPVDLVQRSRPVTVINDGDGVQLRLSGTALDSGMLGDTVRVRLGDRRQGQRMLRAVVMGLGTVRLTEGDL